MKIYLSRFLSTTQKDNIKRVKEECAFAFKNKAKVVVFPELFLTGYKGFFNPEKARKIFEEISKSFFDTIFVFGTISEERRNRSLIYLNGKEILCYDKVFLFKPNKEDKIWEAGREFKSVKTEFINLGVIICNDLRFPESARSLKINNKIDLLVVPSYWPLRRNEIFRRLLQARAIENAIFVAGCCISHLENRKEKFYGALNYLFDPLGNQIETKDDLIYEIEIPYTKNILVDPTNYL